MLMDRWYIFVARSDTYKYNFYNFQFSMCNLKSNE